MASGKDGSGGESSTLKVSGGNVVLPFNNEQFRDFIKGLLGRPQRMRRWIPGSFSVDKEQLVNIHHLLEQRINSQNDGHLFSFSATIAYSNGSAVTLNSIDDFMNYAEVQPLYSVGVNLVWSYLIQFDLSRAPERQVIVISFGAVDDDDDDRILHYRHLPSRQIVNASGIRFSVAYTNRTWGNDIESLLFGHLRTFLLEQSPLREFLRSNSSQCSFAAFGIFVSLSLYTVYAVTNRLVDGYLKRAESLQSSSPTDISVADRVDFLISIIATGMWTKYAFYVTGFIIVSIIISAILSFSIESVLSRRETSFVVLTRNTKEKHQQYRNRNKLRSLLVLVSPIGSVAINLLSNYLFALFSAYWGAG